MTRKSNFDNVAWFYDPLVRIVFGKQMRMSQIRFLDTISPGSTVLILGGGTGWILDELFARTGDCTVYYVESSRSMLDRATKHGRGFNVRFIPGGWEGLPDVEFDAVITHYFLDLFTNHTLQRVCDAISARVKRGGTWLVSDFVQSRTWHRIMLWIMYRFFGITCGIEAAQLPAWEGHVARTGFVLRSYDFFYGGFMKSARFVRGNAR
ncbi:MAG TPA: class I SAM-dependent methyltransferase [Cyclobacteriaceae bacterium]|jgi:ubiquinone/menaquinone biosynthesis C-methylase UbiE